jgi:hypothetical protein
VDPGIVVGLHIPAWQEQIEMPSFSSTLRQSPRSRILSNDSCHGSAFPWAPRTPLLSGGNGLRIAVVVAVACACGQRSAAADREDVPVATVRVNDYAQIPTESIARAQQLVTETYRAIGVRTEWLPTVRPAAASAVDGALMPDTAEFVILVLSPSMTRRQAVSEDTVGRAAVTRHNGGRVAYVFFDHVHRVAGAAARNAMDVMGLVMAHEIGHLLLPYGHSRTGLMRPMWDIGDLQSSHNRSHFAFTPEEADLIRKTLRLSSDGRSSRLVAGLQR